MDDEENIETNEDEEKTEINENEGNIETSENEGNIETNEYEGNIETNEYEEKTETAESTATTLNVNTGEGTGKGLSNQSTAVKIILGIVAICCIGIIVLVVIGMLVPGGISYEFGTNTAKFPYETTIGGVTFHLPEGYTLVQTYMNDGDKAFSYQKGSSEIAITNYPSSTMPEILSNLRSNSNFKNIGQASFSGISGYTAEYSSGSVNKKIFLFEKSGETFLIEMTNDIDFREYMPKIL